MSANKTTIKIQNAFPSLPSMWTNRFDVRIWNELQSVCNNALEDLKSHRRNMNCTTFLVGFVTSSIILASVMIAIWAGSYEEYCCDDDYTYYCDSYCYREDEGSFIFSMIMYGISGFTLVFVCPAMVQHELYSAQSIERIEKPNATSPQSAQANMSLQDKMQFFFKSINDKYQNMIIFNVKSVHFPEGCPQCNDYNLKYFELEIEMRVQQIAYIPDPQSTLLATQQQFQVGSLPNQQLPIQIVSTLPAQQQTQPVQQSMQQHGSLPTQQSIQMMNSLSNQQQMYQNGPLLTQQQPIELVTKPPAQQQNNLNYGGYRDKHYTQWTTNDVLNWMMQLDNGLFAPYQQKLAQTLNNEQIDGNDLLDLDKNDLHRLGIQQFKLKKSLLAHIQSLH